MLQTLRAYPALLKTPARRGCFCSAGVYPPRINSAGHKAPRYESLFSTEQAYPNNPAQRYVMTAKTG